MAKNSADLREKLAVFLAGYGDGIRGGIDKPRDVEYEYADKLVELLDSIPTVTVTLHGGRGIQPATYVPPPPPPSQSAGIGSSSTTTTE